MAKQEQRGNKNKERRGLVDVAHVISESMYTASSEQRAKQLSRTCSIIHMNNP